MKRFASTFAALALLAAAGQAAPLDSKNVAADAKWVVHIDVDAIRDSHVVKKAFETCPLLKNESGKHFDKLREKIGIDLRKDLHGITLYGRDTEKTHGVAIVFTKVEQKLLLDKAAHASDHKVTRHGKIDIHSWTQKCCDKTHTAAGAFYKPDVLVFAASVEGVAAAIDVLDGKSPGITDPKSPLGGHVSPGATVLARAIAIRPETRCPILKQAASFRVSLGERDGKSFYHASLVMKSPEAAAQVKAINDGVKAITSLKFSGNADVMKLINGLQVTVKDNTVHVRWEASADDVWTVVDKLAKKAAEHFKQGGACPFSKDGKGECPFAHGAAKAAGKCPAGCQCPVCKAKAAADAKAKSANKCPPGCQCPACKAKAATDAKAKSAGKCPPGCQCPACKAKAAAEAKAKSAGKCPLGCQCPACKAKATAEAKAKCPVTFTIEAGRTVLNAGTLTITNKGGEAEVKGKCPPGCQCPACKAKTEGTIKLDGIKAKFKGRTNRNGTLEGTLEFEGTLELKCDGKAKCDCPAGCQCPACKGKAEAKGGCPAGCQCPACKAKAEAKAKAGK